MLLKARVHANRYWASELSSSRASLPRIIALIHCKARQFAILQTWSFLFARSVYIRDPTRNVNTDFCQEPLVARVKIISMACHALGSFWIRNCVDRIGGIFHPSSYFIKTLRRPVYPRWDFASDNSDSKGIRKVVAVPSRNVVVVTLLLRRLRHFLNCLENPVSGFTCLAQKNRLPKLTPCWHALRNVTAKHPGPFFRVTIAPFTNTLDCYARVKGSKPKSFRKRIYSRDIFIAPRCV